MKWDTLFTKQQELDKYIAENHDLKHKDVFEEKFLALLVELGELANETRCFKFWSKKAPSEKQIILEEYVDNIHFLLSIGLEKGYTFSEIDPSITYLTYKKNLTMSLFVVLHFIKTRQRKIICKCLKSSCV